MVGIEKLRLYDIDARLLYNDKKRISELRAFRNSERHPKPLSRGCRNDYQLVNVKNVAPLKMTQGNNHVLAPSRRETLYLHGADILFFNDDPLIRENSMKRRIRSASIKQLNFISKLHDQKGQEAYREVVRIVQGNRRTLTMFSSADAYHIINLLLKWDDITKAVRSDSRPIPNRVFSNEAERVDDSERPAQTIDESLLSFKKKLRDLKSNLR